MAWQPEGKKISKIHLFVFTLSTNVTDRGTDRQTDRQRTESATICVLSDLLDAVDRGDTAALVLLDLTAAIDTVDHEILLERLRVTFGEQSLAWFQSYLVKRTQHVRCGGKPARVLLLPTSSVVPQRSVF